MVSFAFALYPRARIQGNWSEEQGAYVIQSDQLPFFVDLEWNLEPDRAVLSGELHVGKMHV